MVIAKAKDIQNNAIRNCVEALLELKKPKNLQAKDHNPKTICEHLAASYLNRTRAVVSALTDLNRSWTFYWFAHKEEGTGVALHKLELHGEGAAGLSKYILESLKDESRRETLPTTFVDRLSFEAVMETIWEDHRRNRARSNFGGGGGNSSGSQEVRISIHHPVLAATLPAAWNPQTTMMELGIAIRQAIWRVFCGYLHLTPTPTSPTSLTCWIWWMKLTSMKSSDLLLQNILFRI